jgi:biopolymer transport protein ExbD
MSLAQAMHTTRFGSPLVSPMKRGRNWSQTRPLIFTLTLTSLIDAFSILVIFLLMQTPSGEKDVQMKGERLPSAITLTPADAGVNIRIVHGQYIIDEKAVSARDLVKVLHDLHAKGEDSIILQADKASGFDQVSPLVQAAAQTGFGKIKFAVLPKKAER